MHGRVLVGALRRAAEDRERELEESHRALGSFFANLPGMAYRVGRHGEGWAVDWASEGALALTGYTSDDLVRGPALFDSLLSTDSHGLAARRAAIEEALAAARPFQLSHCLRARSGEEKWVWEQGHGVFGPRGALLFVEGIVLDVTDRHVAELAFRENEARLSAIIENAPVAIYVKDREGRFVLVNRCGEAVFSMPAAQILGARSADILPPEVGEAARAHDAEVFAEGAVVSGEEIIPQADGLHTYASLKFPLPGADGRVGALCGISTDITEKKRAEENRRFLLGLQGELVTIEQPLELVQLAIARMSERMHVAQGGLGLVDLAAGEIAPLRAFHYQGGPGDWSRYPVDMLGDLLSELRAGRTVVVSDSRSDPRTTGIYEQYYAGFGVRAFVIVPLLRRGEWTAYLVVSEQVPRVFREDEVELVRAVAQLVWPLYENARLLELARESVHARDVFLSVASHELRTPLTPLTLRVQMLERELERQPDSPFVRQVRVCLDTTKKQARRLEALVGDLLDVSRLGAGKLGVELEEVDFAAVARDVVARLEAEALRLGSPITLVAPAALEGMSNKMRLDQVLDNLLSNALKYGAGKPIAVTLELGNGSDVVMRVKDQGIGIAPDAHRRIFEPFERAVSERHYGGLGLGLHIAAGIVQALDGTIEVESVPGQGATFTVTLPLRPGGGPQ